MKRTCTVPDCGKPHRARGLCNTHYGQRHQPERHKKRDMPCAWCGVTVRKFPRSGAKFGVTCSDACRTHVQQLGRRGEARSACTELVRLARIPRTDGRYRPSRKPRRYFAGNCHACGAPFISIYFERTCSAECKAVRDADAKRDGKHRRRAIIRGAAWESFTRTEIFERDNWTCWICHELVDRDADPQSDFAPSLDHIIPLANGGTHQRSNAATACRGCNSRRSNRPTLTNRAGVAVPVLF